MTPRSPSRPDWKRRWQPRTQPWMPWARSSTARPWSRMPDRAQGRLDRASGQRGIPRLTRDRPRASLRPLRPATGDAASPGAARAPLRRAGAHPRRRLDPSGHDLDEEYVERLARELAAAGIEAVAIAFLNSFANPSWSDARGKPSTRRARYPRLDLVRRGAGDPGVRAHLDDRGQRLRPGPGRALPARPGGAPGAGGIRGALLLLISSERPGHRRDGRPLPGPPAGERSRRGALAAAAFGAAAGRGSPPSIWGAPPPSSR